MKQIVLAALQYAQDYDETLAIGWEGGGEQNYWYPRWYPYCKNVQIFDCPSHDRSSGTVTYATGVEGMCDYATICETCAGNVIKLARVDFPAENGLLFETGSSTHRVCPVEHDGTQYHRSVWDQRTASGFPPHNEGLNVGFMDGHAKWLAISSFAQPNARIFWY